MSNREAFRINEFGGWIRWISWRQCVGECRCTVHIYISFGSSLVFLCFLCSSFIIEEFREPVRLRRHTGEANKHSLDPRREADDREEEPVCVEIFEHALNRLSVDPERDAGSSQVQAAAHHVLRGQDVLVQGRDRPRDTTCSGQTHTHTRSYVKYDPVSDAGTDHVSLAHTHGSERTHCTHKCTQLHTLWARRSSPQDTDSV